MSKHLDSFSRRRHLGGSTPALLLGLIIALAGCASSAPEQRLLALPTPALPQTSVAAAPDARWLQVGRLDIPEYWQSRAVRYRDGSELKSWDDTVWGERVEVGLTRNLSIELEHALPSPWRLCPLRCEGASRRPVRLLVSLSPMDYDRATQTLTAWAQWTVIGSGGEVLSTRSEPLQNKGSGTGAAAQTDAMAGLMKTIAGLVARDVPSLPASATERLDAKNRQ